MTRKLFLSLLITLVGFCITSAQSMNDNYDRNTLTVILLEHGDQYDRYIDVTKYNPGDKFDVIRIPVTAFRTNSRRFIVNEQQNNLLNVQEDEYARAIRPRLYQSIADKDVPKQIIGKWFNRTRTGFMDLKYIQRRAEYNATDETYNITNAQALGKYLLQNEGLKLVDNSYILVVDHGEPKKVYNKDSNGNITGVTWSAPVFGWLFKLDFNETNKQRVFDCWIQTEDSRRVREEKNDSWASFQPSFYFVQSVFGSNSSSIFFTQQNRDENQPLNECIHGVPARVVKLLENKVAAWQVKTVVFDINPVRAKIGTKEGLTNMQRYQVVEHMLDDNGQISTSLKGWVRATEVVANKHYSRGSSETSTFYQIAGGKIEKGMLLTQKNSRNIEVKALMFGGAARGFGLGADYLFGMNNSGAVSHIMLSGGYNSYKKGFTTSGSEYELTKDLGAFGVRLGYGYGLRPFRPMEVIPNANLFVDLLSDKAVQNEKKTIGYGFEAGADINFTVWYPVKLTAGAYYSMPLFGGENYLIYNAALKVVGAPRQGFTFRFGITVEL